MRGVERMEREKVKKRWGGKKGKGREFRMSGEEERGKG